MKKWRAGIFFILVALTICSIEAIAKEQSSNKDRVPKTNTRVRTSKNFKGWIKPGELPPRVCILILYSDKTCLFVEKFVDKDIEEESIVAGVWKTDEKKNLLFIELPGEIKKEILRFEWINNGWTYNGSNARWDTLILREIGPETEKEYR